MGFLTKKVDFDMNMARQALVFNGRKEEELEEGDL
jgi:hypothetical protein